jgi:hypothetical protein
MVDLLGYAASAAVLGTFLMRSMLPLRLIAILSNILFLLYGHIAHIHPVFLLHVALLPINALRLFAFRRQNQSGPVPPRTIKAMNGQAAPDGIWFAAGILAGGLIAFAVLHRLAIV